MKDFEVIDILAGIVLLIGVLKLIILFFSPAVLYRFVGRIYSNSQITKSIYLVLAAIVLYLLVTAGITILEIFAVSLFFSLLMGVGLANYAREIINQIDPKTFIKENLIYIGVWIVLMIWGISELFIS